MGATHPARASTGAQQAPTFQPKIEMGWPGPLQWQCSEGWHQVNSHSQCSLWVSGHPPCRARRYPAGLAHAALAASACAQRRARHPMTSRTAPLRPGRGHCWVPWQQPAWWVVCLWHVCCWRIAPDHGLPAFEFEFQPWGRGGPARCCCRGTAALALPPAPAPSCGCLTPLPHPALVPPCCADSAVVGCPGGGSGHRHRQQAAG